jgi:hypothetical protein
MDDPLLTRNKIGRVADVVPERDIGVSEIMIRGRLPWHCERRGYP